MIKPFKPHRGTRMIVHVIIVEACALFDQHRVPVSLQVEDDIEDDMKKLIRSDTAPPSDLSSDNNMYSEAGTKSIGGDYTEMITNMRYVEPCERPSTHRCCLSECYNWLAGCIVIVSL